jgi:hypothetical protein
MTAKAKPVPAWRAPWRLDNTPEAVEENIELATELLFEGGIAELFDAAAEAPDIGERTRRLREATDDLAIAIDQCGWALVPKDAKAAWPMYRPHPLSPQWAASVGSEPSSRPALRLVKSDDEPAP